MVSERRSEQRQPLELKIRLDIGGGQVLLTRDLSVCGAFVDTQKPLPIGKEVQARLELPTGPHDRKHRLELRLEVRHHNKEYLTHQGNGPFRGMGVRFLRMSIEERNLLVKYLDWVAASC